jgi:ketosteroid isomerase-like protein
MSPEALRVAGGEGSDVREIVETFYECLNRRDAGALDELISEHFWPDAVLRLPDSLPYGGVYEGSDKIKRLFVGAASAKEAVGPAELALADVAECPRDGDDQVVVQLAFAWIPPGGGEPVRSRSVEWWKFRDLRVVEITAYYWDTAAFGH